jgi:hypothetical protein
LLTALYFNPVPPFWASIWTPGITAPDGSVTTPVIVLLSDCAIAANAAKNKTARVCFIGSMPAFAGEPSVFHFSRRASNPKRAPVGHALACPEPSNQPSPRYLIESAQNSPLDTNRKLQ